MIARSDGGGYELYDGPEVDTATLLANSTNDEAWYSVEEQTSLSPVVLTLRSDVESTIGGKERYPGVFPVSLDDVHGLYLHVDHRVAPCESGAKSGAVNANQCGFDLSLGGSLIASRLRYNRVDEDGREYGSVRVRLDAEAGAGVVATALQDGIWYRTTSDIRV